ncbi:hypothetical protein AMATHDRAFT_3944 [Amanita thiersii Skay4041]|uniref:Mid2 domain-containing protein n=1 Tax=Amanita thiersii Skay4041 TaxID=703135 RepID=A0A2A9NK58_9AGAR|nr:hypothetical protein AMATHDRAFT_3944 [Amanita thiersii Skay4041]
MHSYAHLDSWDQYDQNCTNVFLTIFPGTLPQNIPVPDYAYSDVSISGNFSLEEALSGLNGTIGSPEPISPPRSISTPANTSTLASTGTPTNRNTTPSGSNNAGAIAGGVVGGVILAFLFGVFAILYRKRRQRISARNRPAAALDMQFAMPTPYPISGGPSTPGRLYDPNDPATYPASNLHSPVLTTSSPSSYTTTFGESGQVKKYPRYPTSEVPEL